MSSSRYLRIGLACSKLFFIGQIFTTHVFSISPAEGPSMLPTFSCYGDWIAYDYRYRYGRNVRVGDVVIYKLPYMLYQEGIKRVIGMPGDYVSVGTPYEPGEELMIQVPQGHCWLVGDNLSASRDSRVLGPVPLALIQGKVTAKVLPWKERTWIRNGLEPATE